jgi:DNA polymerase-4
MDHIRKIIHVDMDAFYASVEQRDRPELKGLPVAVGGERQRGVVAAASYEARKFGVHSAVSSKVARMKCPQLIFVKPDFEKYKAVSRQIREIFYSYTDLVEPLSLDEAFLDVTFAKRGKPSATLIARDIKKEIMEVTGLTASAGVSYNKFLAKVASDVKKPNGLFVITPDQAEAFLEELDISKFFGIGKVTAQRLNEIGVFKGADLKRIERNELVRMFGKAGSYYYDIVRGIDDRPVEPHRERKSLGAEHTFESDITDPEELKQRLELIADDVARRVEKAGVSGKTITLKVKFEDFEQITRSKTTLIFIDSREQLLSSGLDLLTKEFPLPKGVRLLGLTLSNFYHEQQGPVQLTLRF